MNDVCFYGREGEYQITRVLDTPQDIESTGDPTPSRNIWLFAWRMAGYHQIWICLLSLAIAGMSVVPIELQKRIINDAIEPKNFDLLIVLGAVFLLAILVRRGLKFIFALYQDWLSQSAIRYCRRHLSQLRLNALENGAGSDDKKKGHGRAVSVVQSEIDKVGKFVGTGFSDPVADGAKLLFVLGYMLIVDPAVAAVALLFFLPQFIAVPLLQRKLNALVRKKTDLLRSMSDTVASMKDEQQGLPERLVDDVDDVFGKELRMSVYKQIMKAIINILNSLAPLSVLIFGGYLYIQGETTLGVIVAFMSGFDRMAGPTRALVQYYRIASIRNEQHAKIGEWMTKTI